MTNQGINGAEDTRKLCYIDQYCTDNATCLAISSHPLLGQKCPYENPPGDNSIRFCGALHCYQHVCLPCLSGMKDIIDGKICYQNQW